ncbi:MULTISPECIES: hypothetical protein [Flavobacterium]|uniref:hypothetical protein n=1 Tax=Flavobacterium TaxID=237 RepID=UPI002113F224|nr:MULTISPECIES: hypothetical protein [Flavobacterium]UUF16656.1 hypothetical protein NLJ00_11190 [Flavobacterium panici]
MSTNHNRIKVADLETNKSNKILITNEKGELEFNDVNNIQTEKYNALDCTTEGKALDARQGKVLKDMIDNVSQDEFITKSSKSFFHMFYIGDIDMVDVDDKSYLKFELGMTGLKSLNITDPKNLYHGRDFILKNGSLTNVTIFHNLGSGNFKFNIPGANNLVLKPEESAHFVMRAINNTNNGGLIDYIGISATVDATPSVKGTLKLAGDLEGSADFPTVKGLSGKLTAVIATDSETQITQTVSEDNKIVSRSKLFNWWTWIKSQAQTISGPWNFTNKVTLAAGTINTPPLIIPNGTLTNTAQNGAIERDSSGKLFTTRNNARYRLLEDDGSIISLLVNLPPNVNTYTPSAITNTTTTVIGNIPLGTIPSIFVGRIGMYYSTYWTESGSGNILPTSIKVEYYLRVTNGSFDGYIWGTVPQGVDYLIYSNDFLSTTTHLSTFTKNASATIFSKRNNTGQNGNYNGIGIQESFKNTRTQDNSNNQDVGNCSFQIVEKITHTYADSTNSAGKNVAVNVSVSTDAFFIEKIR